MYFFIQGGGGGGGGGAGEKNRKLGGVIQFSNYTPPNSTSPPPLKNERSLTLKERYRHDLKNVKQFSLSLSHAEMWVIWFHRTAFDNRKWVGPKEPAWRKGLLTLMSKEIDLNMENFRDKSEKMFDLESSIKTWAEKFSVLTCSYHQIRVDWIKTEAFCSTDKRNIC